MIKMKNLRIRMGPCENCPGIYIRQHKTKGFMGLAGLLAFLLLPAILWAQNASSTFHIKYVTGETVYLNAGSADTRCQKTKCPDLRKHCFRAVSFQ
jgi:hypothetical protein